MAAATTARTAPKGPMYKNAVGCYLHGSILPKNPALADWLICPRARNRRGIEIRARAVRVTRWSVGAPFGGRPRARRDAGSVLESSPFCRRDRRSTRQIPRSDGNGVSVSAVVVLAISPRISLPSCRRRFSRSSELIGIARRHPGHHPGLERGAGSARRACSGRFGIGILLDTLALDPLGANALALLPVVLLGGCPVERFFHSGLIVPIVAAWPLPFFTPSFCSWCAALEASHSVCAALAHHHAADRC